MDANGTVRRVRRATVRRISSDRIPGSVGYAVYLPGVKAPVYLWTDDDGVTFKVTGRDVNGERVRLYLGAVPFPGTPPEASPSFVEREDDRREYNPGLDVDDQDRMTEFDPEVPEDG